MGRPGPDKSGLVLEALETGSCRGVLDQPEFLRKERTSHGTEVAVALLTRLPRV